MDEKTTRALNSWRGCPANQQPNYPDQEQLQEKLADLRTRPPLVFAGEVDALKELLGQASQGKAFVLTGGDCAETFAESTANRVRLKNSNYLANGDCAYLWRIFADCENGENGWSIRQTSLQ